MDPVGHPVTQGIIHKPMASHGAKPCEAGGHDSGREMARAAGSTSVPDMTMAVIDNVDFIIWKTASQPIEDLVPGRLHWLASWA